MAIIISQNNQNARRIEESSFDLEDNLQEYVINNPEIIPLYDIHADARLFVAAREFSTQSGPIDALGFDVAGNIYIIETKMFRNADKRKVVAQALDYGASMWRHATDYDAFLSQLDAHTQKQFDSSFKDQYQTFFEVEDAAESIATIKENLSEGNIKFVVLMDSLDDRLKDLILYVNQNSKFDIYAVDFEYYKHDQFEIVIPKLYGSEVKKDILLKTRAGKRESNQWLIEFIKAIDMPEHIHIDYDGATSRYLRFTTDTMDSILPSRGVNDGGWKNGRSYMYEIYSEGGFGDLVQIHFQLNKDDLTEHESQLHEKIVAASGRNVKQYNHWFRGKVWRSDYDDEKSLKSELLRIFEQEIPAFERDLLEKIG